MPTLTLTIAASADDADEAQDGSSFASNTSSVRMNARTSFSSLRFVGGMRFPAELPGGATITNSYLSVVPLGGGQDNPNVDIYAEAIDDSPDFSTSADVTSRVRGSESAAWVQDAVGTSRVNSPALTAVVQEWADRAGRVSGDAITILVWGRSDVTKPFQCTSWDSPSSGDEPQLIIEYTVPSAAEHPNIPSIPSIR